MSGIPRDVLVIGAGTAGSYIAWKLAGLGFSCIMLEKDSLVSLGSAIGPFHMEEIAFERFGIPLPEEPELLHRFSEMTTWSPRLGRSLTLSFPTLVMDKPLFHQRLHSYAREAGVDIVEEAGVSGLVMEGGMLRGVRASKPEGEAEWRARLVIDASGIAGAVRTRMPHTPWFENDPVTDADAIFVYMETWKDLEGPGRSGVDSFPSFIGWTAPGPGDTYIVGVGAGGSFAAAERRHRQMVETLSLKGTVVGSARGVIPYRRPPLSLVDNALMVVGDAACMNKPFSGEGVTSGFTGCEAAITAAAEALAADDLTREGLWRYNRDYFRGQGAKFAFLTAVLPALMLVSEEEMETFFSLPGMMTEESALALQEDFEVRTDRDAALKALPELVRAVVQRKLSLGSLATIARMGIVGTALRSMYERYPATPLEFGPWKRGARFFWGRADRVKRRYFQTA